MKRIQHLKGLETLPDPHQCFDVIAGAGTGAVQACMLGRLRMPVDSAIQAYASLAEDVFSEKKRFGSGSFKTTKLKGSLRKIIQEATGNSEELMIDQEQMGKCKTLVFAMSSHNMRANMPTAFRSYPVSANEGPKCTIWETLCATMAHPDLFKSFDVGSPPLNQSFVDAGLGCNNPLVHVLAEVKSLYQGQYVASVTSVGTGHTRTIQIPNSYISRHLRPTAAIVAMKNIATDTERVAEEIARRFNSMKDVYFRLNVDQGLQSVGMDGWEQLSRVLEHTRAYTKLVDVNQRIDNAAWAIYSRKPIAPVVQIDGEIRVGKVGTNGLSVIRRCPAPNPTFTGRKLEICGIELCINPSITERKVCVVHGLGGVGKTQVVLKVVEGTYNQWKEVIYIDASTRESIETALKEVAIVKKVGDAHPDALKWLESCCERWLVVFDNADDPLLPLRDYIPRGNHGSIIITTRLSGMVSFAQGPHSDCSVSGMDPHDALALLLKLARKQVQGLPPEEDFDHFALAIVHAGSFIGQSPHMSFVDYRSMFMGQQQRTLDAYSRLPMAVKADNYKHTVYTTWLMCYELLSPRARELLWLIAFLHHTGITVEIFRRAATNIVSIVPKYSTTHIEDSARQKLQEFLCSFMDADHCWDGLLFAETINEIVSRSLLEYDHMNRSYRIHVLVQGWIRTIMSWGSCLAAECARTLLSVSIPIGDTSFESVMFRMGIGPHIDKVLSEASGEIGLNHASPFAWVYEDRGLWNRAERLRLQTREANEQVLGSDHPDTLATMNNLALAYRELNRCEEARDLQVRVLNAQIRVLGKDHPNTLLAMNNLASIYSELGQYVDALELQVRVLSAEERVLGSDHPDTLMTMNNLALTYSDLNRYEEAKDLQAQALDAQMRVLGEDHPNTLLAANNLATISSELGQFEDARDLEIRVMAARKRVLGNDHPDTLITMNNLALIYSDLRRYEEARDLQVQILDAQRRTLGEDHPNTLLAIHKLTSTYLSLGLWEEAERLRINVDKFAQIFGGNSGWTHAARDQLREVQRCRQTHTEIRSGKVMTLGGRNSSWNKDDSDSDSDTDQRDSIAGI